MEIAPVPLGHDTGSTTDVSEPRADRDEAGPSGGEPRHVAIIMDGNGRWAKSRGLPRSTGHRQGTETVRRIVRAAIELELEYLTLFSFSAENWTRPAEEISDLMGLMKYFIRRDLVDLHRNGVRILLIGSRENVDPELMDLIDEAVRLTAANTAIKLVIAFNYGSRQEIAAAAGRLARRVLAGELAPDAIDVNSVSSELMTVGVPDPDLIIRTSGEQRLSNFLLWQAAYAELLFIDVHWPDFTKEHLEQALACYRARERRFGGLSAESLA